MLNIEYPFVLRSTHEKEVNRLVARAESFRIHRDDVSARLTALQDEYRALERQFNAMEARYDKAAQVTSPDHEFLRDCLAWIEEAPLYVRGVKTPDLIKRRKDIREQAQKLGIVDVPEEEEQSA